ncbi:methyltransferase domain-containing protein [Niabella sp. CJ426]|uniref:methyltransferase domain-containing protein n=1 Tax=Niabella sp. CJ426 TaxID=3393740 RepID=UPI003D093B2B
MPDFSTRSSEKELLDDPLIPFKDIRQNMQELNTINTLLGGHAITKRGFRKILGTRQEVSICEIGCGGGDNLFAIDQWCKRAGVKAKLTGIDINAHCVEFAKDRYRDIGIEFICSDYKASAVYPDVIFSSLFCHHFTNEELVSMLQWMQQHSKAGFFINDLHRHPLAWWSITGLTKVFSRSYLVKNDAPLSVLRGFKKKEWRQLLRKAGVEADINWQWAFRYLIVYKK